MLHGSKSDRISQFGLDKLSTYGLMADFKQREIESMIDGLLTAGCLEQKFFQDHRPVLQLTDSGRALMAEGVAPAGGVPLPPEIAAKWEGKRKRSAPRDDPASSEEPDLDPELLDRLLAWRSSLADEQGVPRYRIASNAVLHQLARSKPRTAAELLSVEGIGPTTVERHGAEILAITAGQPIRSATSPLAAPAQTPASSAPSQSTVSAVPQPMLQRSPPHDRGDGDRSYGADDSGGQLHRRSASIFRIAPRSRAGAACRSVG